MNAEHHGIDIRYSYIDISNKINPYLHIYYNYKSHNFVTRQGKGTLRDKKLCEYPQPEPAKVSSMAQQCKDLISKDVDHWDWGYMACSSARKVEEFISKLSESEKLAFMQKFMKSKEVWKCSKCRENTIEKHQSEYIQCSKCSLWYHNNCVVVTDELRWNCGC